MISSYISLVDEDESTVLLSSDEEELPEVSVTQTRYIILYALYIYVWNPLNRYQVKCV